MKLKTKELVMAIGIAIAGSAALLTGVVPQVEGFVQGGQGGKADLEGKPGMPAAHADAVSELRHVSIATAHNIDKQETIARAQSLLRQEKIAAAQTAGEKVSERALDAERYRPTDVVVEADGSEHVRMDRTYRGLPVIGGDLVVHSRDGKLLSSTRTLDLQIPDEADLNVSPQGKLSKNQAILVASKHFDAELLKQPSVKPVYYALNNQPTLAYEVEFLGSGADRVPVNQLIYVDANTGNYLNRDSKIFTLKAATGHAYTLFRGKVEIPTASVAAAESPEGSSGYLLQDPKRGDGKTLNGENKPTDTALLDAAQVEYEKSGVVSQVDDSKLGKPYFDTNNVWGDSQIDLTQRIGAEVHYGVAKTWDYYKQRHDRNGIANDGKGIRAVVNVESHWGGYSGAFWLSGLNSMFHLNGSAEYGTNPGIALETIGHEMTHGVTDATAKLIYSGESGGLNEANSDIMGTMVEFFDNNPKDPPDYLIGEGVMQDGKPYRYMFKPSLDGESPDCYDKKPRFDDPHSASGVGNHFFYLLSEGAVVPASYRAELVKADLVCNGDIALTRITNKVAAQVWYRAITLYMTSQTGYPKAREATQQAAADLLDRGLLNKKQANAVACAWEAVNVPLPDGSKLATCQRT